MKKSKDRERRATFLHAFLGREGGGGGGGGIPGPTDRKSSDKEFCFVFGDFTLIGPNGLFQGKLIIFQGSRAPTFSRAGCPIANSYGNL